MKIIEKLIIIFFVLIIFTACSGSKEEGTSSDNQETPSANVVENSKKEEDNKPEFEELTVVDNDYMTMKFTDLDVNGSWGYTLKVNIENKSDNDLLIGMNNASIDGVMCDPFWATSVAVGKKMNGDISWPKTLLEKNGLSGINNLAFTLNVSDNNTWDSIFEEECSLTIDSSVPAPNEVTYPNFNEQVIVDNDQLIFKLINIDPQGDMGYTLRVYIENKTNSLVLISWDEVSVNGYMCDPFWATTVSPNCRAYADISWGKSQFDENGITDVSEIEFNLRMSSYSSMDTLHSDTYTIEVQ